MYAYICFTRDNVRKIVDVTDIKDFRPKDVCDFKPASPVRALWRGLRDEIPTEDAQRYTAQVLKLGETREDLMTAVNAKRIAIPKLRDVTDVTSQSSDEEETQFEVSQSLQSTAGRAQTAKDRQSQTEQARLKGIVNKFKQTTGGHGWSDDDVETSGGECAVPDKLHREVVEQRNRYKTYCHQLQEDLQAADTNIKELEGELHATKKEIRVLQILNYKLQSKVISAFTAKGEQCGTTPGQAMPSRAEEQQSASQQVDKAAPAASPQPPAPASPPSSQELFHNSEPEYKLDLRPDVVNHIRAQKSDSLFVKSLAVAIWGTESLASRSVKGNRSNRFQSDPKPPLTPKKLLAIEDELSRHMAQKGASTDQVERARRMVPKYINEKIQDINRKAKKGAR